MTSTAHAHAPLARQALVNDDGSVIVRVPGFGFVTRTADGVASYSCDAMFGLDASVPHTALASRDDHGFLLGAAATPLRIASADGCTWRAPTGWPETLGVGSIAHDESRTPNATYFAVSAETSPALYRSTDNGEHWELRARLDSGGPVTGLRVVQPAIGPSRIFATRPSDTGTTLLTSTDEGLTFNTRELASDLTLLEVVSGSPDQLWLLSPLAASGDVAIVRGTADATTFETVHRVRFFGGLALETANNTVWIADEAGALVRSTDGGDNFEATPTDLAIACLVHHDAKLWACTAGTNQERALAVSDDDGDTFDDVFMFAGVDRLVSCGARVDPQAECAAAWREWQRDALDVSTPNPVVDAETEHPNTPPPTPEPNRPHAGCAVVSGRQAHAAWLAYAIAFATSFWRRRQRR